jgi:hypothetical protein
LTRKEHGNFLSVHRTVRLYCIFQLAVFVFCPFTSTPARSVDDGVLGILPSELFGMIAGESLSGLIIKIYTAEKEHTSGDDEALCPVPVD